VLSPPGAARRKVYPDAMGLPGFYIAGNVKGTQATCGWAELILSKKDQQCPEAHMRPKGEILLNPVNPVKNPRLTPQD